MYGGLNGGPEGSKSVQWNQGAKSKNGAKKCEFGLDADELDGKEPARDRNLEG